MCMFKQRLYYTAQLGASVAAYSSGFVEKVCSLIDPVVVTRGNDEKSRAGVLSPIYQGGTMPGQVREQNTPLPPAILPVTRRVRLGRYLRYYAGWV